MNETYEQRMSVSPPHKTAPHLPYSDLERALRDAFLKKGKPFAGMPPDYLATIERRKVRTLITGASGSGGSYLAEYALDKAEVHGLTRWRTSSVRPVKTSWTAHECDLLDLGSVIRSIGKARPEIIFHLASHANVRACFDTPISVLDNNIRGTANLLEAVRILNLDTTILMCSSSEVYGQIKPGSGPLTEETPLNPVSPYAVSKLAQDALGYSYFMSFGLKVIRTRMFTYLNPRRSDLFATSFAMQVAEIEQGKRGILQHGNLNSVRTVLDVRDAVRAYWLAALKGVPGEVYNIGGTETITVGDFLSTLKLLANCPILSEVDPKLMRPADVTLQIPDCSKFKSLTGWAPEISFKDSVAFLLDHCREVVSA